MLAVNKLAVNKHFQLDQARRRALADHRVVEGAGFEDTLPLAADGHIKQEARFAEVVAGEDFRHGFQHGIDRNIGKKTEPALVDADQRHAEGIQGTGDIQHGAIAAKHHGQIGLLPDLFQVCQGIAGHTGAFSRLALHQHGVFLFDEKPGQAQQRIADLRTIVFANQGNGFEELTHAAN
jgi:hypothetical protein